MPRTRQTRSRSVREESWEDVEALRDFGEEEANVDEYVPMEEDRNDQEVEMVDGEDMEDALPDVRMSDDDATPEEEMRITMTREQLQEFQTFEAVKSIRERWPVDRISDIVPAAFWEKGHTKFPVKEDKDWELNTLDVFRALSNVTKDDATRLKKMTEILEAKWERRLAGIAGVVPGDTLDERELNFRADLKITLQELKTTYASEDTTKAKGKAKAIEHGDGQHAGGRTKDRSHSSTPHAGPSRPPGKRPSPTTDKEDDSGDSARKNTKRLRSSSGANAHAGRKATKHVVPNTAKDLLKGIYGNWNITDLTDVAPEHSYRRGYRNDSDWASDLLQLFYDLSSVSVGQWGDVQLMLTKLIAEKGLKRFAIESVAEIMEVISGLLRPHHDDPAAEKRARCKAFVAQILAKWGMTAEEVIPDTMRKRFTHPDKPYKWDISALKQLCQMVDVAMNKADSISENELRAKLHEGYQTRLVELPNEKESRDLSIRDTQYVLTWLSEQPDRPKRPATSATAAPKAPTGASTATAPATNTASRGETSRPIGDQPLQGTQTPNALPGDQVTYSGGNTPSPRAPESSPAPGGRIDRRLAEAEHNLNDAIHLRSIAEAELSLARSRRDTASFRAYHSESELAIKEAEQAVGSAALKVEKAKKQVADLRWERVKMSGT
jgi:hypothetical protein